MLLISSVDPNETQLSTQPYIYNTLKQHQMHRHASQKHQWTNKRET